MSHVVPIFFHKSPDIKLFQAPGFTQGTITRVQRAVLTEAVFSQIQAQHPLISKQVANTSPEMTEERQQEAAGVSQLG